MDIQQSDDGAMRELALFAGAGGGILGGMLLGWRTVCAVEINKYAASVLVARQNDGILPPFPIWDDICTFDGRPWRGIVDVISGGFPCQDISKAKRNGQAGVEHGSKSGLWKHMARIIGEVRPEYVFVENAPAITKRGLNIVCGDLSVLGYDARWGIVSARQIGAPHKRERMWIRAKAMAYSRHRSGWPEKGCHQWAEKEQERTSDSNETCRCGFERGNSETQGELNYTRKPQKTVFDIDGWWAVEPGVGRVVNGMAARVDRLKAIGNGQVPAVAATAWRILNGKL